MKHVNIKITGTVQGVFFRASARDKARELAVSGFARNEPDGSVYLEVEGEEGDVDQFVAWCAKGPERARVEKIEVNAGEAKGFSGFDVRR